MPLRLTLLLTASPYNNYKVKNLIYILHVIKFSFTGLLDDYLVERTRITNLTAHADSLRDELDQLIADIQESSVTLRECTRTP